MKKKYFITGVSDGLGKELCKQLLRRGDIVYGVSRRQCDMNNAIGSFIWKYCDVTNARKIKEVIEHQVSIGFLPDVVILNAGVYSTEGDEFVFEDLMKQFRINCEGSLRWIEEYLPTFRRRGAGHFVYISSIAAIFTYANRAAYSSSKGYVSTIFSSLRKQHLKSGIFFTTIYPGMLETKMTSNINVPAFLKYQASKGAGKILKAVDKKKSIYIFPAFSFIRALIFFLMPVSLLKKLLSGRDKA